MHFAQYELDRGQKQEILIVKFPESHLKVPL
jgi:hypothetical protein